MYQFHLPRSLIEAGSTTPRISVASISTAAARPTPNSCRSISESVAKIENTATITAAAAVTTPAEPRMPCSTAASLPMPRSQPSLMRLRMNTW